jgi:BirA family biotin operon repressor/biotin-[acetyl-CoA-carboxylase] ligase
LSSDPPDLSLAVVPPADIADALASSAPARAAFGSPLYYFATIGSTNELAGRLAERGAAEGTTVAAETQTAGRGRLGRAWFSPPGAGLYVSVVIRPDEIRGGAAGVAGQEHARLPLPSALTLGAGVALAEAVRETTGLGAEIKWPNDLVFRRRKLAGILAEASAHGAGIQYVVIGFGVNIRAVRYPPEVAHRATSIEAVTGRPVERGVLLARALARLGASREALRRGDLAGLLDRWRGLSPSAVGSQVEWRGPAGSVTGRTAGLDGDGALLLDHGGRIERVVAGEIIWL